MDYDNLANVYYTNRKDVIDIFYNIIFNSDTDPKTSYENLINVIVSYPRISDIIMVICQNERPDILSELFDNDIQVRVEEPWKLLEYDLECLKIFIQNGFDIIANLKQSNINTIRYEMAIESIIKNKKYDTVVYLLGTYSSNLEIIKIILFKAISLPDSKIINLMLNNFELYFESAHIFNTTMCEFFLNYPERLNNKLIKILELYGFNLDDHATKILNCCLQRCPINAVDFLIKRGVNIEEALAYDLEYEYDYDN